MTLTQQELDEIDRQINDFIGNLEENHGFIQLIRDHSTETYHLQQRFTRQRQLAVNSLFTTIKEELQFYTDLTTDQEVETAIEIIPTNIECQDAFEHYDSDNYN